ncbi:MAG: class I SAM-dependent rRNA methyltransferase, partial [Myxococcales bacterium]|nr:class I SAM-dependent rRNA methyltransferase [Myxococcales bacterium]
LLRGEPAPPVLRVLEHGTPYLVQLDAALSTGLFLDQRPQRTWLSAHAGGLRVLNTFAHAGGFSVAAARAGAMTVSVDLSRAWLDRIPPQLAELGVDAARHDRIYGDVFDWLGRLGRRGERFDLVILDPPSTSVGKRKKRWSAARDYPELVALAMPLVAPGGRLWTATNHRKLDPHAFARLVGRGLPDGCTLERICPPAVDFPCLGPAPVKTFVWRAPG